MGRLSFLTHVGWVTESSRLIFAFIHEESDASNEDAGAEERAKRISKSSVALLEDCR